MGQVASERVVNGIKTRVLHGKDYVEVAERIRILHDLKKEVDVLESQPYQVANHWVWRVIATIDGKRYIGSAEVKLDAPKGTPDGTNPFECAETSAYGRMLAFAGLGTVDSISSFDEVYRATYTIEEANGNRVVEAAKPKALPQAQLQGEEPAPDKPDALEQAIEQVKREFSEMYPDFVKRENWFKTFQVTALGEVPAELGSTHVAKLRKYLSEKRRKQPVTSGK